MKKKPDVDDMETKIRAHVEREAAKTAAETPDVAPVELDPPA